MHYFQEVTDQEGPKTNETFGCYFRWAATCGIPWHWRRKRYTNVTTTLNAKKEERDAKVVATSVINNSALNLTDWI